MENSNSFVSKDDDISAVVFSVKETKKVLEDQVENIVQLGPGPSPSPSLDGSRTLNSP